MLQQGMECAPLAYRRSSIELWRTQKTSVIRRTSAPGVEVVRSYLGLTVGSFRRPPERNRRQSDLVTHLKEEPLPHLHLSPSVVEPTHGCDLIVIVAGDQG